MAKKSSKIWMEHGALQYFEAVGDDLDVKMGLPFPKLVKANKDETVLFSWVVYKSNEKRGQVPEKGSSPDTPTLIGKRGQVPTLRH